MPDAMDRLMDAMAARLEAKNAGAKSLLGVGYKDLPSGTPSTPYMTGPGGLFNVPGVERDVISTRIEPRGVASILPAIPSVFTNPEYMYITGFTGATGDVANGVCDNPQTAGPVRNCVQTARFGRYSYQTRDLEITRVGVHQNRVEPFDLRLMNDPLVNDLGSLVAPSTSGAGGNIELAREVLVRFLEVGVDFQNTMVQQLYTGNPANDSAGGGYREFPGLDILIGTNKFDSRTGVPCSTLNSDIKNFNCQLVDQNSGLDLVNAVTYLMRYLRYNADHMNMGECRWVLSMRPELFYEITAIWPCAYLTYRCQLSGQSADRLVVDARDAVDFRDAMRNGSYLMIDGYKFEVIQDNGITERNSSNSAVQAGCFCSDIYVIPMSVRGGVPVTYWEYLDFSQSAMVGVRDGRMAENFFWTDGGRYMWHFKPPNNWCVQWLSMLEPRVIELTPHLAGRLLNVGYCPLQHTRDALPGQMYFDNSGVDNRAGSPLLYSDWHTPGSPGAPAGPG